MDSILLKNLEQYMFSSRNVMNYNKVNYNKVKPIVIIESIVNKEPIINKEPTIFIADPIIEPIINKEPIVIAEPMPIIEPIIEPIINKEPIVIAKPIIEPIILNKQIIKPFKNIKKDESFTPFQKDKLFWCFYIILKGFSEYEINRTGYYAVEKAFKISSVEKLRTVKSDIKDLKLKISEVEDELVNKEQITLKGLQALCFVYKVSVTYIFGKKYCEFLYGTDTSTSTNTDNNIISQNYRKDNSLLYETIPNYKQTHWFIENVQKPLKAPASYTLKELQDICEKLDIPLINDINKKKNKKELYEDILSA
jgi:hypothetical protein